MHLAEQAQNAARCMEQDYEEVVRLLEHELAEVRLQADKAMVHELYTYGIGFVQILLGDSSARMKYVRKIMLLSYQYVILLTFFINIVQELAGRMGTLLENIFVIIIWL